MRRTPPWPVRLLAIAALGVAIQLVGGCAGPSGTPEPPPVAPLDAEELRRARPLVAFDGPGATSGWLLMRHVVRPVIAARIGERAVPVLLDTGAGVSVIDAALVDELGLPTRPVTAGAAGSELVAAVGLDMRLGAVQLREVPALVLDLAPGRTAPTPVILGAQVFHELVADFDFPHHRVALYRRGAQRLPDGVSVGLRMMADARAAVDVSIHGAPPRAMLLATGAEAALSISAAVAQAMGWSPRGEPGGEVRLRRVDLARQSFADVTCQLRLGEDASLVDQGLAGCVGAPLLSRFRMVVDYRQRIARFARAPG